MGVCASAALCRLASLLGTLPAFMFRFLELTFGTRYPTCSMAFFYFCFAFMLRGKKKIIPTIVTTVNMFSFFALPLMHYVFRNDGMFYN